MAALRRVHLVAVCHQLTPEAFLAKLQSLASACRAALRGVVVCNNEAHAGASMSGEVEILQGSNRWLDFSGYFEGLDCLLERCPVAADDTVLFVNDSLFTKHAGATILRHLLALQPLVSRLKTPAIAGKYDPYRAICLRNPWSGDSGYVSSFCFLLNPPALALLRDLPSDALQDGVLGTGGIDDASWGTRLPGAFRELVRAHLVYEGSPSLWPSASASEAGLLHRKACCVYFEHRLSGHIGARGALVPINAGPRSSADIATREWLARAGRVLLGRAR